MKIIYVLLSLIFLDSCYSTNHFEKKIIEPVLQTKPMSELQNEVDEIYSLLAYSLVYKDWQSQEVPRNKRRGYNISAVLVDSNKQAVFAELNCINLLDDATQHAELRTITKYISKTKCFNLEGATIYTTLEPCVMCAGMMTMTAVKRNVYGQHDVEYSKAFERLAVDTRSIGGFAPYPRRVEARVSTSIYCARLDSAYQTFLKTDSEKILAKFLASEEARKLYKEAYTLFTTYQVRYSENVHLYTSALSFLNTFNYEKSIK